MITCEPFALTTKNGLLQTLGVEALNEQTLICLHLNQLRVS